MLKDSGLQSVWPRTSNRLPTSFYWLSCLYAKRLKITKTDNENTQAVKQRHKKNHIYIKSFKLLFAYLQYLLNIQCLNWLNYPLPSYWPKLRVYLSDMIVINFVRPNNTIIVADNVLQCVADTLCYWANLFLLSGGECKMEVTYR